MNSQLVAICKTTSDNLKKVEFILTTIIGTILLWTTVLVTIDVFNFLNDKETYSMVHYLNMNKKGFEWGYLNGNFLFILVGLMGLTIIGLRFTKPNNDRIKKMNFGLIGLFLLTLTIGLLRFLIGDFFS